MTHLAVLIVGADRAAAALTVRDGVIVGAPRPGRWLAGYSLRDAYCALQARPGVQNLRLIHLDTPPPNHDTPQPF